jgi:hypothetical protein
MPFVALDPGYLPQEVFGAGHALILPSTLPETPQEALETEAA